MRSGWGSIVYEGVLVTLPMLVEERHFAPRTRRTPWLSKG